LLLVSPVWANYFMLSADGFTYCHYDAENIAGETCSDSELTLGGDCQAACAVLGNWGYTVATIPWGTGGNTETVEGSEIYWTYSNTLGVRTSAEIFTLSGDCGYLDEHYAGPPEIAVFRFAGDPSVFDGTAAGSVSDLVELGLVEASDVLLLWDCSDTGAFSFDVDVAGVPNEELVVFAAATAIPGFVTEWQPVPAVSVVGTLALSGLMLGAGAWHLRKRN
jgi:hypothetical protein